MTIDQSHGWKRHPLVTFFILTNGIAWALWLPIAVLRDAIPASLGFVLNLLGGLVPSAVAIVLVGMVAVIVVTIVSGPEHLSRTHQKLETPPTPPTRVLTPTSLIGMGPPSA